MSRTMFTKVSFERKFYFHQIIIIYESRVIMIDYYVIQKASLNEAIF